MYNTSPCPNPDAVNKYHLVKYVPIVQDRRAYLMSHILRYDNRRDAGGYQNTIISHVYFIEATSIFSRYWVLICATRIN